MPGADSAVIEELDALARAMAGEALQIARACCPDGAADESCRAYHGVRLFLHRIGARGILASQHRVFYRGLHSILRSRDSGNEPVNILVSGAADFAVPVLVARSCHDAGARAAITVLDRCSTPLELCRKVATRVNVEFDLQQADILAHHPDSAYDLVCTDRFFGFFAPETRPALVRHWARMLRRGGYLLVTVRIRNPGTNRAREAAPVLDMLDCCDPSEFAQTGYPEEEIRLMTQAYLKRRATHAVADTADITSLLEAHGFQITGMTQIEHRFPDIANNKPYPLFEIAARLM